MTADAREVCPGSWHQPLNRPPPHSFAEVVVCCLGGVSKRDVGRVVMVSRGEGGGCRKRTTMPGNKHSCSFSGIGVTMLEENS